MENFEWLILNLYFFSQIPLYFLTFFVLFPVALEGRSKTTENQRQTFWIRAFYAQRTARGWRRASFTRRVTQYLDSRLDSFRITVYATGRGETISFLIVILGYVSKSAFFSFICSCFFVFVGREILYAQYRDQFPGRQLF